MQTRACTIQVLEILLQLPTVFVRYVYTRYGYTNYGAIQDWQTGITRILK